MFAPISEHKKVKNAHFENDVTIDGKINYHTITFLALWEEIADSAAHQDSPAMRTYTWHKYYNSHNRAAKIATHHTTRTCPKMITEHDFNRHYWFLYHTTYFHVPYTKEHWELIDSRWIRSNSKEQYLWRSFGLPTQGVIAL